MFYILKALEDVRDNLTELNKFKKVFIGMPKGIERSKETPFAIILLDQIDHKGVRIDLTFQLVIAIDIKNDLEELYKDFLELDYLAKENLFRLPYKVAIETTFMDEDKLTAFKAGIIRFKILDLEAKK